MRKIVIAGGSGFLGKVLLEHFRKLEDEVVILTRGQGGERNGASYVHWDGEKVGSWAEALEGVDVLINLCGRTVNCRYTEKNKNEILQSRILSTKVLGEALKVLKNPPTVWLNSSSAFLVFRAIGVCLRLKMRISFLLRIACTICLLLSIGLSCKSISTIITRSCSGPKSNILFPRHMSRLSLCRC